MLHDLLAVFPATLELATLALIVGAVLGIVAGVLCARYAGSPWDLAVRTFTLLGNSVPIFWLGLLMLALFYARLQWAPGPGRLDDIYQYTVEPRSGFALIDTWLSGDTAAFKNAIGHLALPVLVLAYYSLASITRLTRSACLSEMNKEYILLARAKGAGEMTILLRHVLPNIRGTLLTVTALAWTSMLEGAVLTETVFSWPGIGRYLTTALFAPWLAPHDPNWQDAAARLQGPGAGHWLGTDSYGRDLLSRLLYGARPALGLVALVTAITLPVGLLVGILSGYYGGWLERILMRFTDVVMSMPRLILAFAFVAMLGPGLVNGALALALTTWPAYARQARSEIQRLRHSDYLAAAEMLGIRGGRLLIGHILPLCLPSAIVRLALDLAGIILAAAGLGFLGLGARPPMAEWGAMIADGMQVIFDQWWIAAIPGAAILLASLAFNLLGDGLRDILEPQHD
ncbi:ABC transporter permease subunit [Klebsiella pneumoniae]